MKLGNDLLQKKFDDIDGKIDFLIENCRSLQSENQALKLEIERLEAELDKTTASKIQYSENEAVIQSKIDGLLGKLNQFTNS